LSSFALSIDAVEKITGRDLFPNLSDNRENTLEKSLQLQRWDFN